MTMTADADAQLAPDEPTTDRLLVMLSKKLSGMTDEQRLRIVEFLGREFCIYCGGKYLPCYCTRDD